MMALYHGVLGAQVAVLSFHTNNQKLLCALIQEQKKRPYFKRHSEGDNRASPSVTCTWHTFVIDNFD